MNRFKFFGGILIGLSLGFMYSNFRITGAIIGVNNYAIFLNLLTLNFFLAGVLFFMIGGLENKVKRIGEKAFLIGSNASINLIGIDKIVELQNYLDSLDFSDTTKATATATAGAGLYFLNKSGAINKISKKASQILGMPKNKVMPYIKALIVSGALTYGAFQMTDNIKEMRKDFYQKEISQDKKNSLIDNHSEIKEEPKISSPHYTIRGKFERTYRWDKILDEKEEKYGIPKGLLKGLAMRESYGDPLKLNERGDGGVGLFQFQPGTAKHYNLSIYGDSGQTGKDKEHGEEMKALVSKYNYNYAVLSQIDERFNVEKSSDAAARFLVDLYKRYKDWDKALSAYNRGTPAKNPQSTNHVKKVLEYKDYYNKMDKN